MLLLFLIIFIIILLLARQFSGSKELKVLGYGMIGTVYELNEKQVVKYSKILEENYHIMISPKKNAIETISDNPHWREMYFAKKMRSKFFMQIYKTTFLKCPDFYVQKYPVPLERFNVEKRNEFKALAKSNFCKKQICSKIEGVISNLTIEKENYAVYFINMLYLIVLMERKGFIHGDFHLGNIGYNFTKDKFINDEILGKIPLPLFFPKKGEKEKVIEKKREKENIYLVAIDFELVNHLKFIPNKNDVVKDDFNFLYQDLIETNMRDVIEEAEIKIDWEGKKKDFIESPEFEKIKVKLKIKQIDHYSFEKIMFFFQLEYTEAFSKIIGLVTVPYFKLKCFDLEAMYYIMNLSNEKKMAYLLDKFF